MDSLQSAWGILAALLPSIGLLYLFWVVMKHIVEGDRRERAAQRLAEAEEDRLAAGQSVAVEEETQETSE
ncbi:MAG: hypothetical protein WBG57_08545 [Ornithinimicrobium sp.]